MISEQFLNTCFSLILSNDNKVLKNKTIFRDILDIIKFYETKQNLEIPFLVKNKIECLKNICILRTENKTQENVVDSILTSEKYSELKNYLNDKLNEPISEDILIDNIEQIRLKKKLIYLMSNYDNLSSLLDFVRDDNFDNLDKLIINYESTIKEMYFTLMESRKIENIENISSLDLTKDDWSPAVDKIIERYSQKNVIPTGYNILDNDIFNNGFERGRLYIINGASGCLTGDTIIEILIKEKIEKYSLKDLYYKFNNYNDILKTFCLKDDIIGFNEIYNIIYSGNKKVFKITTNTGKFIKGTEDHRFKVPNTIVADNEGFKKLKDLKIGDYILCKDNNINDYQIITIKAEEIISIEELGIEQTFDIIMKDPYRNFIGNNFIVHNSGKSTLLLNCLQNAALDRNFKNINPIKPKVFLYISLENTIEESLLRLYTSRFNKDIKTALNDIHNNINIKTIIVNELLENNSIIIMKYFKGMTLSPLDIEVIINEILDEYGPESLVELIIDYLDILKSDRANEQFRLELSYITMALKSLAVEYNIAVITGSQLAKSVYTLKDASELNLSQTSESSKKIDHSDAMILMIKDPLDDTIVHVKIGKNRVGKSNISLQFKVNFEWYKFINGFRVNGGKPILNDTNIENNNGISVNAFSLVDSLISEKELLEEGCL